MQTTSHPRWEALLGWLSGHGMNISNNLLVEARSRNVSGYGLIALRKIPPATPLFTVPAKALLNSFTLKQHYPPGRIKLSSVQLISLHLLLHRPDSAGSLDPLFGPYISVLPDNFDENPLTWHWRRHNDPDTGVSSVEARLLVALPTHIARRLARLADAFQSDWGKVSACLQDRSELRDQATNPSVKVYTGNPENDLVLQRDYLWAWLNVNTRCIYYRIKQSSSDPDNLTMCPILDFANHSSSLPSMFPDRSTSDVRSTLPGAKREFTLFSPPDITTSAGEELFLRYGSHTNQFLFVEYGFVNSDPEWSLTSNTVHGDIDISPRLEQLFKARGDVGKWMTECLVTEGYWGNWTLHSPSGSPAHPSYRVITALRLYHVLPSSLSEVPQDSEAVLRAWRKTMNGEQDMVSTENEALWRATLHDICQGLMDAAESRTSIQIRGSVGSNRGWVEMMKRSIETLWLEEFHVSKAVIKSICENEQF